MIRIFLFFSFFFYISQLHAEDKFYIKGNIEIKDEEDKTWLPKVYLLKISYLNQIFGGSRQLVVDSAEIKSDGSFFFNNASIIQEATFYRLNVIKRDQEGNGGGIIMVGTNENFIILFLKKNSQIELKTKISRFGNNYFPIHTDSINYLIYNLNLLRKPINEKIDRLIQMREKYQAKKEKDLIKKINKYLAKTNYNKILKTFADTVSNSYVSLLAAMFIEGEHSFLQKLYLRYQKDIPHSDYTTQFEKSLRNESYLLPIGTKAPDIKMKDLQGNMFDISVFQDQYLLIDFWASWCLPCRKENVETILPTYNKYKNKGFNVLSISQDIKKTDWLQAIKNDKIEQWTHLCDFKGQASPSASAYHVSSLPTNYLIDKNGNIIARDLRGTQLEDFLSNIFKE